MAHTDDFLERLAHAIQAIQREDFSHARYVQQTGNWWFYRYDPESPSGKQSFGGCEQDVYEVLRPYINERAARTSF